MPSFLNVKRLLWLLVFEGYPCHREVFVVLFKELPGSESHVECWGCPGLLLLHQ